MKRVHQRGYNLVEVLIAMALLGVVVMSIASLFIWGRRNVYSGKQMTTAIAIGTRVLEDLAPLSRSEIYNGVFDIADTASGQDIKFGTPVETYEDAAIRSTKAGIYPSYGALQTQKSTGPKLLDKWTKQLQEDLGGGKTRDRLSDAAVTLILMPRNDDKNDPPQFGNSTVLQMRVIVSWREQKRKRQLVLDTVKAY
ncbi:MAG: prepilin-type N-terminal cleavage/methylation domain-containing protein [Thermoanaerobaculia bacterium]